MPAMMGAFAPTPLSLKLLASGLAGLAALLLVGCQEPPEPVEAIAAPTADEAPEAVSSPVAAATVVGTPTRLLWGDLHVHSNLSFDAFSFGNKTLTPADTFAFARGDTLTSSGGLQAKLAQPLDFLMVSDHAEFMGVMRELNADNPALMQADVAQRWKQMLADNKLTEVIGDFVGSIARTVEYGSQIPVQFTKDIWQEVNDSAEEYNNPGTFTALIGYEWTSMIDGRNLHRNVIFRDGPDKTLKHLPYPSTSGRNPEELWAALQAYVDETSGDVITIPHNGNLSDGLMFAEAQGNGEPITDNYAKLRMRWEPVYEMTQVKGDAEAHPLLSPDDPFADFENWDETNIGMDPRDQENKAQSLAHEYARPVLKTGLKLGRELGTNPFKFGMIGSTDAHTSLATADSDNFYGKFKDSEPSVSRLDNKMGGSLWPNRDLAASGYAAVWARDNTRAEIYDALARREVYASSGPRIVVRFFAGWNLPEDLDKAPDVVEQGYALGVPMGGDLPAAPTDTDGPDFVILAEKDALGAGLDRVQVIKGWLDEAGELHEKIYDVAWAGDRTPDPATGLVAMLPSTVDADKATYDADSGATSLSAVWRDPNFNAADDAFYYVRVLQVSTPRWTTYDAVRYAAQRPTDVPAELQERAYTSPIWYTPPG